ncbi:zinc finger BED domain-containing protein RICESLEEPER 2-like [Cornus florida]|uniref:zinc finger BED domain-containing protein RICESLEEPER 2-like n=1 Tax=Cornus florida TaxID=4283 RepID=UPI002897C3AD|nr:zinc finger BED domain-containing protein RICESLEEPER 2-like [Cornus florida]
MTTAENSNVPRPEVTVVGTNDDDLNTQVCATKNSFISDVWDHFTKEKGPNCTKLNYNVKCNYCSASYSWSSGNRTSTLRNHISRCQQYPFNVNKKQKLISFQSTTEGEGVMVSWKFDQELCRQALTKMIIIDELPFKFVEREGFCYFLSVLQPKFKLLSRFTVVRDCLKLYAIEKKRLKTLVNQLNQRICFTTDIWTSIQNLSYMCLTAHFFDKNWTLHKRILNFCIIPSHKGKEIGRAVETCLLDWGIDKLCTFTVDNASSNDLAVAYLKEKKLARNVGSFLLGGECFHMRCCAHILNLIVKDGLSDVNGSIVRICEAVKYVRSSPQRGERFQACVKRENITFKSHLCLDVSTRWNSTYLMLEVAVKFQKAFKRLEDDDIQFLPEVNNKAPSSTDWEYA